MKASEFDCEKHYNDTVLLVMSRKIQSAEDEILNVKIVAGILTIVVMVQWVLYLI